MMQARMLLAGAPLAAVNLSNLSPKKVTAAFKSLKDKVYYGDILPPVGSQQISYARFMDLLHDKRIKRVILLSDGKIAMVEVPVEGYASKLEEARYDRKDEECVLYPLPAVLSFFTLFGCVHGLCNTSRNALRRGEDAEC